MAGHAKRNSPEDAAANTVDKDNATAPPITKAVLTKFLTSITGAITTAITTAVSAVRPVSTPKDFTVINPFDMKSMDLTSRD